MVFLIWFTFCRNNDEFNLYKYTIHNFLKMFPLINVELFLNWFWYVQSFQYIFKINYLCFGARSRAREQEREQEREREDPDLLMNSVLTQ